MRLIDGDALTKRFEEFCNKNCPYTAKARNVMCGSCFMGLALEAVEDVPTIEPERKKGKWILVTDGNGQHYVCDHCGQWRYHQGQKFCSECGLKMEEGEQDV